MLLLINYLMSKLVMFSNYLNRKSSLQLVSITHSKSGRYLEFHFTNDTLEDTREVLEGIYLGLMTNKRFKSFGSNKIIITSGMVYGREFSYHHNVLLTNTTTFEEYYHTIKDSITSDHGCTSPTPDSIVTDIIVKVWNMDHYLNKKIKITKSTVNHNNHLATKGIKGNRTYATYAIKPKNLKEYKGYKEAIVAMDIETMDYQGLDVPVIITLAFLDDNKQVISKLFEINKDLLTKDVVLAVNNLWLEFVKFILDNQFKYIFVHNLGGFDGLFIYKALSSLYDPSIVSTIIDEHNKFITIKLKLPWGYVKWIDSYRIFQVSLEDLCRQFNVEGKISKYQEDYHSITLFKDEVKYKEFIDYAVQDSIALLRAMLNAQEEYLKDFNVDLTSVLSTSMLSLKIFVSKFLNGDIPILKGSVDQFIRLGYYGGGTDYYKCYGENLHYYDINSLYPYVMCKPMPLEIIKHHRNMNYMLTENCELFWFFQCEVKVPDTLRPLIPFKYKGKTIYPSGTFTGVYFSEEIKTLLKYGYTFKLISGYEFSKADLFTEYVNYFYDKKRNSQGSTRFIAKMHLNQLYGIFGRRLNSIETINIYNEDIEKYLTSRIVKAVIKINEEKSCLLLHTNIDTKILKKLNTFFETDISGRFSLIKSNVAIAAAVTSYAITHMIPFKVSDNTLYTDTDSIFTDKPLDPTLISNTELGLMKDELAGKTIDKAYFIGIKQYGYIYKEDNKIIERSTFSGVPWYTITFEEIIDIHYNNIIIKYVPKRFSKYYSNIIFYILLELNQ